MLLQLLVTSCKLFSNIAYHDSQQESDEARQILVKKISSSYCECRSMLCMSPNAFEVLCDLIRTTIWCREYENTSIEDQFIIFLFITGQNFKNRVVHFFFVTVESISRYFHDVLNVVISLKERLLMQPDGEVVNQASIGSSRFFPFFKVWNSLIISSCIHQVNVI